MGKKREQARAAEARYAEAAEVAHEYIERRLWTRVDSDAPILVRVPGEPFPLVAFALGSAGEELGVTALRGEFALEVFEESVRFSQRWGPETGCDGLLFTVSSTEALWHPLTARAKPNVSAPAFLLIAGGVSARHMEPDELALLGAVIRTLIEADRQGKLLPRPFDQRRRVLEIRMEGEGKGAVVHDRVVTCLPPRPLSMRSISVPKPDAAWYSTIALLPRSGATWTCRKLPGPPIGDEPRASELLFLYVNGTGELLQPELVMTGDVDALVEAFTRAFREPGPDGEPPPGVPDQIDFVDRYTVAQLQEAFGRAGIRVTVAPRDSAAVQELEARVSHFHRLFESHVDATRGDDSLDSWRESNMALAHRVQEATAGYGDRALALYFGDAEVGERLIHGTPPPPAFAAFLQWYAFDHRPRPGARTTVERMLARGGLSEREVQLLAADAEAPIVLGRVVDTTPGTGFVLENLVDGSRTFVHDRSLSMSAQIGLGLILRLASAGGWTFAQIAGPPMAPMQLTRARAEIEDVGLSFENGEIVGDRALLGRLFVRESERPAPTLQNTDGEPFESLVATFHCGPTSNAPKVLSGMRIIEKDGDRWVWIESRPGRHGFENGVVMGHIELIGDELLVHVNSRERVEKAKRLFGRRKGIRFVSARPAPPEELGGPEPTFDDDVLREIEAHIQAQMMAWLDLRLPLLGGKTPREAAKVPALREKVADLIRSHPDSHGPNGVIRAPRAEMLRELGLGT